MQSVTLPPSPEELGLTAEMVASVAEALSSRFGPDAAVRQIQRLAGQASNRVYYRLALAGIQAPDSAILMKLPPDPFASEEASGEQIAAQLPFCNMLEFLDRLGLAVPVLYADRAHEGYLLLQDLGEITMLRYLQANPRQTMASFRQAITLLVDWQKATQQALGPADPAQPGCVAYGRRFDYALLRSELHHFKEWALLEMASARLTPQEDRLVEESFDALATRLAQAPTLLVHRDFQSTNLMRVDSSLVLIDFQDALVGPVAYDLVALLRDSYLELEPQQVGELVAEYCRQAAHYLPVSPDQFEELFHLQTLQRKLKDAGRFVFIDRVKGNPNFLPFVAPSLRYVGQAFDRLAGWDSLRQVLGRWLQELGG